nr:hypothetical protein Ahy_B03g063870 isoform K [Ipomoea batatas]
MNLTSWWPLTLLLQMEIHAYLIHCIILILQDVQMHIKEQSQRLEEYCSFMIQTNAFLHGDLEHDQLMVQSPIAST